MHYVITLLEENNILYLNINCETSLQTA